MFARALRRRCPVCGGGPLFVNWLNMTDRCPSCGIRMRRGEDGYTLGALWFNLFLAELITTATFVTALVRTWPNPPWDLLQIVGPIMAILMPLLVWPFARMLFLAFDLCIRPPDQKNMACRSGPSDRCCFPSSSPRCATDTPGSASPPT